jgi:hypothetical protein
VLKRQSKPYGGFVWARVSLLLDPKFLFEDCLKQSERSAPSRDDEPERMAVMLLRSPLRDACALDGTDELGLSILAGNVALLDHDPAHRVTAKMARVVHAVVKGWFRLPALR